MRKSTFFFLLIVSSIFYHSSCTKEKIVTETVEVPGETVTIRDTIYQPGDTVFVILEGVGSASDIVLGTNTKSIGSEGDAALINITDSELYFSQATGSLEDVAVGDIIAGAPTEVAQYGFLRRVLNKEEVDNQLMLETENVPITEAMENGDMYVTLTITEEDLDRDPPEWTLEESLDRVLYDADGNPSTTNDQLRAEGQVNIGITLDIHLLIEQQELSFFEMSLTISQEMLARIVAKANQSGQEEWDILQAYLNPVLIQAGIPVVITPRFFVEGKIAVDFTAEVEAATRIDGAITAYVQYSPVFDWVSGMDKTVEHEQFLDGSVEGSATLSVDAGMGFSLYGLNELSEVALVVRPELSATATFVPAYQWSLDACVGVYATVGGNLFGNPVNWEKPFVTECTNLAKGPDPVEPCSSLMFDNVTVEDGEITIEVSGGNPPYEYAIGSGDWQIGNLFEVNLTGLYVVKCRDVAGCYIESLIEVDDVPIVCGFFTDMRDMQEYKWVEVGTQRWMAQNLNYDILGSVCFEEDPQNCELFGRLYDWPTMMNGEEPSDAVPSGVRGICPEGWHIPSDEEWKILERYLGMPYDQSNIEGGGNQRTGGEVAFQLRSIDLWLTDEGTNMSGMNVFPTGYFDGALYRFPTTYTGFMTSSEDASTGDYWYRDISTLGAVDAGVTRKTKILSAGHKESCRCVQD